MSLIVKKKGKFFMGFYICLIIFLFERVVYYVLKYLIYIFFIIVIVYGGFGIDKG